MQFLEDVKANQKIEIKFRALKLIVHAFTINLGIRHFTLYGLFLYIEQSWTSPQINIFVANVSKMKVTKILTKGVNKGNIPSTGKERSTQIVHSRTALH